MIRKQKAWLLWWEWVGDHAVVEDRIAAILPPRWSTRRICDFIEVLYARQTCSATGWAELARRWSANPYKAECHGSHVSCGHNPMLMAHHVFDLAVRADPESGLETVSWKLSPRYERNEATGQIVMARGPVAQEVARTVAGPLSDRETGRYRP